MKPNSLSLEQLVFGGWGEGDGVRLAREGWAGELPGDGASAGWGLSAGSLQCPVEVMI